MTLSVDARRRAVHTVLVRMFEDLGEGTIAATRFAVNDSRFNDLPQTTWMDLEGDLLVTPMHAMGNPGFRLTGRGWIAALKASGTYATNGHMAREIALRKGLKDAVKGRPLEGAITSVAALAAATSLPEDWIANAIESRLVQLRWLDEHLDVDLTNGLRAIRIPARFGMKRMSGLLAGPIANP